MKKAIVLTLLFVAGCGYSRPRPHHRREHVKVYHLKDGRYCYKHHDSYHGDIWYWLYLTDSNTYYTSSSSSVSSSFRPPSGAVWVSSSSKPVEPTPTPQETEEISAIEAAGQSMSETIITDGRGTPEVDADGNLVDPDSIAPSDAYDAPANGSDIGSSGESNFGDTISDAGGVTDSGGGDPGGDAGGGGGDGGGGGGC